MHSIYSGLVVVVHDVVVVVVGEDGMTGSNE